MSENSFNDLIIEEGYNPYRECIQGTANEPICVLAAINKAWDLAREIAPGLDPGTVTQAEIVHRLVINKPRIAVITGSADHPAHLRDDLHISLAVLRIWQNGGVPFVFGIPVICDGTAQSNIGQSYSLASRNHTASAVNITFEGHSYHAAYVLSSCDKFPAAVLSGLAAADLARSHAERQQAPVWALFVPEHVLKGGSIPVTTKAKLNALMDKAREQGHGDLAADIAENMRYILQCSSDEAFLGQLNRAVQLDLLAEADARQILNELAAATCDAKGGVCAFNGTGNSSRTLITALGFAPPEAELLIDAPAPDVVSGAVDLLYASLNKKHLRVIEIIGRNFKNAVRLHNTTGSSSNILLHLPAIMRYAGYDISILDYEQVRGETPVPELFAHSLTAGRDTFVLAQQFLKGQHRGIDSLYRVLSDLGIAMDLDAPTMTDRSWGERIAELNVPVAPELGENAIIRTAPVRQASGVEVLRGNFMSTAIVKLAGMTDRQLDRFNDQLLFVRYYENEHLCIDEISSPRLMEILGKVVETVPQSLINAVLTHNSKGEVNSFDSSRMHDLVATGALSFAFVIAGQGPRAFGMPEMFAPAHHLKHHQVLEASSILMTDGRYSGVTKGACVGHVTPEAFAGGGIGALVDGDILRFNLHDNRLDVVDVEALVKGTLTVYRELPERSALVNERQQKMQQRLRQIAASNLMNDVTSAEKGCVPQAVDLRAENPLPS